MMISLTRFHIRSDMPLKKTLIKKGTMLGGKIIISMTLSVRANTNDANTLKN